MVCSMTVHQTTKSRSLLKVSLLIVCLALPLLLGAGDVSQIDLDTNRNAIKNMSARQREHLKNQHKILKQLPPKEQQQLHNIHQRIEDDSRHGGEMATIVKNYNKWLGTLSPWQREELRKQENPAGRIALIKKYQAKQNKSQSKNSSDPYAILNLKGQFRDKMQGLPRLSDHDLEAVMQVIQAKVNYVPQDVEEFKKMKPVLRHIRILKALVKKEKSEKSRSRWPSEETLTALLAAISNKEMRKQIAAIPKYEMKREVVNALVLKSILQEWHQGSKQYQPTADQIAAHYKTLPAKYQEKLSQQSPRSVNRTLVSGYRMKHDPTMREMMELRKLMSGDSIFRRGGGNRRPRDRFNDKREKGNRPRPKRPSGVRPDSP